MKRVLLLLLLTACGGGGKATAAPGDGDERVVYEKLPDGSVKKTTIRTTKHVVPMAPPPARPADPYPADPLVRYNVDRVNAFRARKGLPGLLYDRGISEFAGRGSAQLSRDHHPHAHFAANAQGAPGFGSRAAENQGDPNGVPVLDANPAKNGQRQIDTMLDLMYAEGPGGGHYDNMMNPAMRRIGVGLLTIGSRLYMTNDLSD